MLKPNAKETVTTVRLSPHLRITLKTMAAARHQTMESALNEAVTLWSQSGPLRKGKVTEECRKMRAQIDMIANTKGERVVQATLVVLDGLCMLP